jgi:hypothetical protein
MKYEALDLRMVWQRAIDVVGAGRLLFGTDSSFFPRGWHAAIFEEQAKTLYELGIGTTDVASILSFNLENLHAARTAVGLT